MKLSTKQKIDFSNYINNFVEIYNNNLNPLKEIGFLLSEISIGHTDNENSDENDIFYFDWPYKSEKSGKIVDIINDLQRGISPDNNKINSDFYKDIDIKVGELLTNKNYVIYKYKESHSPTVEDIITDIDLNDNNEEILKKYFFLIYHCTVSVNKSNFNLLEKIEDIENERDSTTSYLLYFNHKFPYNKNKVALTATFCGKNNLILRDTDKIKNIHTNLFPFIEHIVKNPSYTFHQLKSKKKLEELALKAAISQVMARNGSHNIGSHVLNQLVRGLKDIDFNNQNYKDSIFILNDHHKDLINCFDKSKPIPKCSDLAFAQLEYFNGYIKNRMEYLGDLAMNTPKMSSSMCLIDEIFRDFDKVRLLLNNISGLGANFKYKINFIIDGKKITKSNYLKKDIKLAIANDITGCQAFFNILENIIRNTAKHSKKESKKHVVFTIDAKNFDTEFFQINIYDNIEKDDIGAKVTQQNETLNKNVLDIVTNTLRQGSLGMIEMDASAAYLRMLDITMINDDDYEIDLTPDNNVYKTKGGKHPIPIFNANKFPLEKGDDAKCLGYQFYIPKPKEFLFITNGLSDYKNLISLKNEGVDVMSMIDFKRDLINDVTFPHQFVIYETEFDINITNRKAQYSPRVLKFDDFFVKPKKINLLEDKVWKHYTKPNPDNILLGAGFQVNNLYQICYNDHELTKEKVIKKIEALKENNEKKVSFEVLSSLGSSKLPDYNNISLKKYLTYADDKTKMKLFEASQNKVLVIDERIQEFSQTKYEYNQVKIQHYTLYQAMNVFMPSKEREHLYPIYPTFIYNLSQKTLQKELLDEIKKFIKTEVPNFLVFHYSILERLFETEKEINDYLYEISKNETTQIIITSGRTRISGLPKTVRFVNLAPILSAFTDIRGKYSINKILNDSRI